MTKTTTRTEANISATETRALQERGRKAAHDGLIGIELDAELEAEGMDRASHRIVRQAFNAEIPAALDRR